MRLCFNSPLGEYSTAIIAHARHRSWEQDTDDESNPVLPQSTLVNMSTAIALDFKDHQEELAALKTAVRAIPPN